MSLLSKIIGIGAVAGVAAAAIKMVKNQEAAKKQEPIVVPFDDFTADLDEVTEPASDSVFYAEAQPAPDAVQEPVAITEPEVAVDEPMTTQEPMMEEPSPVSTLIGDVGKAATEVYGDVSGKVKEVAQKAGVDTDELTGAISDAGKAIFNASKAVATKVSQETPVILNKIKGQASNVAEQAQEVAEDVSDAVASVTEDTVLGEMPDEVPTEQEKDLL